MTAAESLVLTGVWRQAQRSVPRFSTATFFVLMFPSTALTALFIATLVHDSTHSSTLQPCWEPSHAGMAWAGSFVHWLSTDWHGEVCCQLVPKPNTLKVAFSVLIPTWALIIFSSWVTRRLRRDKGVIRNLLERIYQALGDGDCSNAPPVQGYLGQAKRNEQSLAFLRALEQDGRQTRAKHIYLAIGFQAVMFVFDASVKNYTIRWILWYQLLWFSISTTILQVRPLIKFSVFLSRTLVDIYIELVREKRSSWLELLEWHRELELDLLKLWGKVNLHTAVPSLPFASFSLIHFIVDQDGTSGIIIATFCLTVAGLVFITILQPISKVSSMLNSSLAIKSEPREGLRRPGSMSVVAVARSFAQEKTARSAAEDQQYAIFLEYVQGRRTTLAVGLPGIFMLPISSNTVASLSATFLFKLPLFVSLFVTVRQHVNNQAAP